MKPLRGWKHSGGILGPSWDEEEGCDCPVPEPFWEKAALVMLGAVAPLAVRVAVAKLFPELFEGGPSPLEDED